MNKTKRWTGKVGFVFGSVALVATTGCAVYSQQPRDSGAYAGPSGQVDASYAEIRVESDFYEPLSPYGRWEMVGSYGRCWIPGGVEADWRPYSDGYWQCTDAGWYWVSDEPWGWATYHYGRWDLSTDFGWYWVPQTQWAPAWVSWHSGGGYIGWAPLYPSNVRVISPRAYVFVEERHFMEPVRRSTVVVNNTTIINKTVINGTPATAAIEKASGRKVQVIPAQELRHKADATAVAKQSAPASVSAKKVQTPVVRNEAQPVEKKAAAVHAPPPVEKSKPVLATAESKPVAKPTVKAVAMKEPIHQNANQQSVKQEQSAKPSDKKMQQPAREKPAANVKNEPNPADKNNENKVKE